MMKSSLPRFAFVVVAVTLLSAGCQPTEQPAQSDEQASATTEPQRETPPPETAVVQEPEQAAPETPVEVEVAEDVQDAPSKPEPTPREPGDGPRWVVAPIEWLDMDDVEPVMGATDTESGFAVNAFPPTMPDTKWHEEAWHLDDCLRCHETGVANAPMVLHVGMPKTLLIGKCRTCHVIEPGKPGVFEVSDEMYEAAQDGALFDANAFPPMIPSSSSHLDTWTMTAEDCLLCHETGVRSAPVLVHRGLPDLLVNANCRTCHVQIRSIENDALDVPSK